MMSDTAHPDQVSPLASESGSLGSPSAIPTSDVGTSTPTSPAISDVSTVPVTECDRSAVVTSAQMGEGSGWFSIAIPLSRSSTAKAEPSPFSNPKLSSAPTGTRDPKGRRDLKNRHDPAKPAATPKLGKQKRRYPG
uniref:Uncharacterized protein n=1 Tax=Peronospora matthiolae TaxID=2874970 RepID=A0AAV1U2H3_9STRA